MIRAVSVDSFPVSARQASLTQRGQFRSPCDGRRLARPAPPAFPAAQRSPLPKLSYGDAGPGIVTNAEFAKVPDLRCTADALHRVRDTSDHARQAYSFSRRAIRPSSVNDHAIQEKRRRRQKREAKRRKAHANHLPRNISKRRRLLMYRRQVYAVCATHLLRGCAPYRGAPAFRRFDRGSRRDSHPCSTPGHASWDLDSA